MNCSLFLFALAPVHYVIIAIVALALIGAIAGGVVSAKRKNNSKPQDGTSSQIVEKSQENANQPITAEKSASEEIVAAKEEKSEPEAAKEVVQETVIQEAVEEVAVTEEQPEVIQEVVEESVVTEVVEERPAAVEEAVAVEEKPAKEVAAVKPREIIRTVAPGGKVLVRVRYNRSYTAKIIQANDGVKNYYSEIKNEIMRYGVTNRISWKHETFRKGRKLLVKLALRGKSLYVYYALNPADYLDTKYKINDVSSVASNAAVPTLYKIKNDRRCKYAKQLIADLMAANGLTAVQEQAVDYAAQYPYEELEPLIERNLVKLLTWKEAASDSEVGVIAVPVEKLADEEIAAASEFFAEPTEEVIEEQPEPEIVEEIAEEVEEQPEEEGEILPEDVLEHVSVAEAEEMLSDEKVEAFVSEGERVADKTKKAIVNIDTLSKYFSAGERVTVSEIKKRIPAIGNKVTYVKVLARGTLDKALTVEADDFSPQAIKMIVLTGGKVIRTKSRT